MREAAAGLLYNETRKLSLSPLPRPRVGRVVEPMLNQLTERGHAWARRVMAAAIRRVAALGQEDSGGAWLQPLCSASSSSWT